MICRAACRFRAATASMGGSLARMGGRGADGIEPLSRRPPRK
jgi:hypothetical protein